MNRRVLLAVGGVLLTAGAGASAFYFMSATTETNHAALGPHNQHKSSPSANEKHDADVRAQINKLIEELGGVQDRVISGERAALTDQSRLMQSIATMLRGFTSENWSDYANVRAALVYVLSGGEFDVLKPIIADDTLYESDRRLATGIMSFAQGQSRTAQEAFDGVDPRSLDISLVGPFALARASLFVGKDNKKAISLFDDARISGPHTAIEEAAARREIPILMDIGESARATMLMADYARRFGKSIYSRKLFQNFAESVAKRSDLDDRKMMKDLLSATETADAKGKADLCLEIANEALLHGKIVLAGMAADAALKMEFLPPELLEKARLYKAAADAPTPLAAEALAVLSRIGDEHLSSKDIQIREVAGFIARAVVESGKKRVAEPAIQKPAASANAEAPRTPGTLEKAEAAIQEADKAISGSL